MIDKPHRIMVGRSWRESNSFGPMLTRKTDFQVEERAAYLSSLPPPAGLMIKISACGALE